MSAAACRACGSTKTREELDALGAINCCPERSMNEVIEERHGVPALVSDDDFEPDDLDDCWACSGDGGWNSCGEDCCPYEGGEEACDDPACWRVCQNCRGVGRA